MKRPILSQLSFIIGWSLLLLVWINTAEAATPVQLEEVRFYYRMDSDARYTVLKVQWQNAHNEPYTEAIGERLSLRAFNNASIEKSFEVWRQQGGPHPLVFFVKAYLRNPTQTAILNQAVQVTVKAKTGPLRVDPQVLMTDYNYLKRTAQWETLLTQVVNVPVLAPGEEILVPITKFQLMRFLRLHPNSWPESIQVEAVLQESSASPAAKNGKNAAKNPRKSATLELLPDHFMLPEAYRY